jgi:hypothetical protein
VVATLPVPIEFSLPPGWRSVPPDEVGTPDAAFVALHPPTIQNGFTANITITGELRGGEVVLTDLGDEAVQRLRASGARDVKLGRRNEVGSADNPGLTQAVKLNIDLKGGPRDVIQFQVFLGMRDQRDPQRQAVLHVVLSSLPEQFEQVIGDFQQFLSTIEPEGAQ